MRHLIPFVKKPPRVAVIRLQGVIAASGPGRLNDQGLAPLIEKAFSRGKPVAVALVVNSPGGSPVQSSLIAARIRRLADEKGVEVLGFVEDVAASGGYWLAAAADRIWADESSIVGSIGVISAGFGLDGFIGRHGVERRVHTSGRSKSFLDPFRPEDPEDVARLKSWQGQIHESFIAHVKRRRGGRLGTAKGLFEGEIWVGHSAAEVGLIDGIGHLVPTLKERYGDKVRLVPYRQKRPLFGRFAARAAGDALGAVEDRAAFARFGL